MANSGNFTVLVDQTKELYFKFSWTLANQSTENNTSTINWKLDFYSTRTNVESNVAYGGEEAEPCRVVIDGITYEEKVSLYLKKNEVKTLRSGSTTLEHNQDGSKSFSAYIYVELSGWHLSDLKPDPYREGRQTFTLDKIYRPAYLVSAQDFTDEEEPTITYQNPMGKFVTLEACISFTGEKDDISYRAISSVDTSYEFPFYALAEKQKLWVLLDQGYTEKRVKFRLRTTIDGRTFIDEKEALLTFVNYKPTLTPIVKDINERTVSLTGDDQTLVRYFSNVSFNAGAVAQKGASLASVYIKSGGNIITTNAFEGVINNIENGNFEFVVTDNRGHSTTATLEKNLIPYIKLTQNLQTEEMTLAGELTFTISGKYFNGSFGAADNFMDVSFTIVDQDGNPVFNNEEKPGDPSYTNGSGWVALGEVTPSVSEDGFYTYTYTITGLNRDNRYNLTVAVIDALSPEQNKDIILGLVPVFDWSKDDFNFNVPISIKGVPIVDHVIEQGEEGYWFYKKWDSGIVEMWGWTQATFTETYLLSVYEAIPVKLTNWISAMCTQNTYFGNMVKGLATNTKLEMSGSAAAGYHGCNIWVHSPNSTFEDGDKADVSIHIIGKWK